MLTFKGSPGSPYTRKMLSLLRYRHLPHRMILPGSAEALQMPKPRVALLPTFYLTVDNGTLQAVTDSTPLIRRFEKQFNARSVIPADPVVRFIDYLLEDYTDEWLTKAMFHYRWHYNADAEKAETILPYWHNISADDATVSQMQSVFGQRQRNRLHVVGSNEHTKELIEISYQRFIQLLQRHLSQHNFLMGGRPGASDFATFGQLTCLAHFDPTPAAITLSTAPRVSAWVSYVEDLSGAACDDAQWIDRTNVAETFGDWLLELGRTYVPVMLANANAAANGESEFETSVDGATWRQQTFAYQRKCVEWIRAEYRQLNPADQREINDILSGTGCEPLVA